MEPERQLAGIYWQGPDSAYLRCANDEGTADIPWTQARSML